MTAENHHTFVDLVRNRAQQSPDQVIYTFLEHGVTEVGRLSYGELDRRARAIASRLTGHGCHDKSVLLVFQPGLEFISGFFGCLYAGAKAVPVHPPTRRHLNRLKAVLDDAKPKVILMSSGFETLIRKWLESGELATNATFELISADAINIADASIWRDPGVTPGNLAFLQYTSGSTGQPKGVMVTHDNLVHNAHLITQVKEVDEHTVNVTWLPQFHDMGLIDGILSPLYSGKPNYMMSPATFSKNPLNWLKAIEKYRATHSGGPCFAFEYCTKMISEEAKDTLDISSWTFAYSAAEPIRKSVMDEFSRQFHRCGFRSNYIVPAYGMAETTLMVTCYGAGQKDFKSVCVGLDALQNNQVDLVEPNQDQSLDIVSCGRIIKGVAENADESNDVVIVAPDSRREIDDGKVGEIWVKGRSVCKGYWNKPELTAVVFQAYADRKDGTQAGPFLRTGDLGFLLDGQLYVTGRIKDVIIIRGANFYPQDIEYAAYANDARLNANSSAAFTIDEREDSIVIVQELAPRVGTEEFRDIEQKMRERVADELGLVVSDIVLIKFGSIDKTSSGKLQRHKVRERYRRNDLARLNPHAEIKPAQPPKALHTAQAHALANTATNEKHLRKIKNTLAFWLAEKCDIDVTDIDATKNFGSMGIDSLSIAEMVVHLERVTGITLPEDAVHMFQTIEELAEYAANPHSHADETAKKEKVSGTGRKSNAASKRVNIVLPELDSA